MAEMRGVNADLMGAPSYRDGPDQREWDGSRMKK